VENQDTAYKEPSLGALGVELEASPYR